MERKNSSLHIPFPRILFRKVKLFEEWFGSLGKYDIYMWVLIFSIGWVAGTLSQFVFLLNEANPINLMQSTCSPVKKVSCLSSMRYLNRVKFSQKLYRYISPRKIDRYRRWTKCPFKILSLFSGPEDRLGGFQPPRNPLGSRWCVAIGCAVPNKRHRGELEHLGLGEKMDGGWMCVGKGHYPPWN